MRRKSPPPRRLRVLESKRQNPICSTDLNHTSGLGRGARGAGDFKVTMKTDNPFEEPVEIDVSGQVADRDEKAEGETDPAVLESEAVAAAQAEGADQDRFARAGLAADAGEAGPEFEFERIDDGEITDLQESKHCEASLNEALTLACDRHTGNRDAAEIAAAAPAPGA